MNFAIWALRDKRTLRKLAYHESQVLPDDINFEKALKEYLANLKSKYVLYSLPYTYPGTKRTRYIYGFMLRSSAETKKSIDRGIKILKIP